jgi:accessory gene regulator B
MFQNTATHFAHWLTDRHGDPTMEPVYAYGAQFAISSAFTYASLFLLAALVDKVLPSLFWIAFFLPLRRTLGGSHASTEFRCYLSSLALWGLNMLALPTMGLPVVLLAASSSVLAPLLMAPVQHPNHPLSPRRALKMRKLAIKLGAAEGFLLICLLFISTQYAAAAAVGILSAAFLGLVGYFQYFKGGKQ